MTRIAMSDLGGEYSRIFGNRDDSAPATSRQRLCKVCGGWHTASSWPHNCRPEAPARSYLPSPRLAPRFDPFIAGTFDAPEVINDRADKRNYMQKHDLVEYDAGVTPESAPSARQWEAEFAADLQRAVQTDPLNRPPTEIIGQTDTEGAGEIDVTDLEIAK
jgi:hypothetical protein